MPYLLRTAATLVLVCYAFSVQALWFSDERAVYQVNPDSNTITNSVYLEKAHELAVDAQDASLWAVTGQELLKYDASGKLLLQINLQPFGLVQPRHLAADPYDGSLWLADEKKYVHLNSQGQLLGERQTSALIRAIALSLDQSLWLLGNKQLIH